MFGITPSNLVLKDKVVQQLSLKSHFSSAKKVRDSKLEIDFDVLMPESGEDQDDFMFRVELAVNTGRTKQTGYVIKLHTDYFFALTDSDRLSDEDRRNLMTYTLLSITIADMRHYLADMTYPFCFGKYTLPYINIRELIKSKGQQAQPTAQH